MIEYNLFIKPKYSIKDSNYLFKINLKSEKMKLNDISRKYFPAYSVYFYVCSLFEEPINFAEKTITYDEKELSGLKLFHKDNEVFVAEFGFDWIVIFEPSKKNKQEEIYNQDDFLNVCLGIYKFLNRK